MKKSILLLVLASFSFALNAQITKGTKMIGLRINYNQNKDENTDALYFSSPSYSNKYKNFNMSLNAGYFVAQNFVLGLLVGYSNYFSEQEQIYIGTGGPTGQKKYTNSKKSIYSAGIYGRYYKMLGENKIGFFGNLNASYLFGISGSQETNTVNGIVSDNPKGNGEITGFNASLSPGVVYFINKSIGLEASFGNLALSQQTETIYYNGETQTINETGGLNFNFSATTFNIGIYFYLSGKKE